MARETTEQRGLGKDWTAEKYIETAVKEIKAQVGTGKVLLALSGGVDSSVVAALLIKAIGKQLYCVHVNHGLLRKGEPEQVVQVFKNQMDANLIYVDATERFLTKLAGVSDPEQKRKIIGKEFIDVFADEAKKLDGIKFLAQGTIYPDITESDKGVKAHHNVGGLPKELGFSELIEPLRMLFKDEVRALGETLGLPKDLVWRQPFPGPGLAIRVIGEVTEEKVEIVRESDAVFREEMKKAELEFMASQYFTVLTGVHSVGVMGDARTYDYVIALRAVKTDDFMTAEWARLPYDLIAAVSGRIVNEVPHVSRVVLDVTTKPPASVEWE